LSLVHGEVRGNLKRGPVSDVHLSVGRAGEVKARRVLACLIGSATRELLRGPTPGGPVLGLGGDWPGQGDCGAETGGRGLSLLHLLMRAGRIQCVRVTLKRLLR